MRNIKPIIIALILGLTAIVSAAAGQQTPAPTEGKEKAASCCTKCSDSCCMKEQKSGDAQAAHKSCDMSKAEGCSNAKPECCKSGAECCKAGAECCKLGADCSKSGDSCCPHHQMSADKQHVACDMKKDGKGCCATSECCAAKTAKR